MKKFLFFIFTVSLFATDATLEITKELSASLKVAVESESFSPSLIDQKIGKMIEADLKVAGFFNVLGSPNKTGKSLFADHEVYNSLDFLVRYSYFEEKNRLGIAVKVYETKKNSNILTKTYTVSKEERYPFLAHHLTIDLANKLKMADLSWMSKFVILSRHMTNKETEILIADYTLTFKQTVIKGGFSVFPKWASSDQREFFYTHYDKKPTLYKVNLYTGKKEKIIDSEGMLVCSDVSSDGKRLLLTMAPQAQPDIYEYNLESKKLRQITNYRGIDVNGHYVDEEKSILFVTDRLGYPEIFHADYNTPQNATQFVFKGRNNNYINTWKHYGVFVSRDTDSEFADNTFNLYLISTKSNFIRQLTTTGRNNFPRFAPSGDTIMHTKDFKKESALGIIRLPYNKSFLFPLEKGQIQAIDW